jgi:tetratricopeptide (TPR) repeat protein
MGSFRVGILRVTRHEDSHLVRLAELHQDIRRAIEVADIGRSRRLCESILEARPDNLETLLLLAEVDLESGNHEAALEGFGRVLGGDPEAYLAYAGVGIAYEALREANSAIYYFSRALDLNPANAGIRQERDRLCEIEFPSQPIPSALSICGTARSYLEAGFYQRAIDAHRMALLHEPERLETRLGLAESLWMMGGTKEPQDLCEEVLSQAPRAVKAHALIACVTAETEDVVRGREMLEEVHVQDPEGRVAGYIVAQTPLAPWAIVDVDLPPPPELDDDTAVEILEAPQWTRWMRQALWQVLRLVRTPGGAPDWSLIDPGDLDARNRTSPYGPLGRRIRAVTPAMVRGEAGAISQEMSPPAALDVSSDPDDDDATQIIMRPWPSPKAERQKKGNHNG